ncbi:MAG TPA: SurA N-terminal domain-containing protein [Gammaproteobacteria bacterium]|nr:SurA N-terminal domain-containing protein [Gammaproteobacteria bacterium]
MLQSIRDKTKGWIAYAIIAVLIVPFALFGVYNYFTGGSDPVVAKVNGSEIKHSQLSRAVQDQERQLRRQLGDQYDPSMFKDSTLRQQALDQLITRQLLENFVNDHGLRVTDDMVRREIHSQQYFQVNGKFSAKRYREVLRQNQLTPQAYEAQLRHQGAIGQLQQAIGASAIVTDAELKRVAAIQYQARKVDWLRVSSEELAKGIELSDDDISKYYEAHKDAFKRPEQVRLSYVELSRKNLAKDIDIPASDVKARYEQEKDSRFTTQAARDVRHIMIKVPKDADKATVRKAREKAEAVRKRIVQGGEDFAKVAKEVSDDKATAKKGGDIGKLEPGEMVKPFNDAVFSLKKGEVSQPVRTDFGWHLIQVTGIQPGHVKPFDEVKDQIRQKMASQKADRELVEKGQNLANVAFEHTRSLQPAAKALGLKVQETGWIGPDGTDEGLGSNQDVVKAAFSDDVLKRGRNSSIVKLGDGRQVVVRVAEHRPAKVLPLADVRDKVRDRLLKERAAQAAKKRGDALAKRLEDGAKLDSLADGKATTLHQPGWIRRNADNTPQPVIRELFSMQAPKARAHAVKGVVLQNGDYAVIALSDVREGNLASLSDQQRQQLKAVLRRYDAQSSIKDMLAALRKSASIKIYDDRL